MLEVSTEDLFYQPTDEAVESTIERIYRFLEVRPLARETVASIANEPKPFDPEHCKDTKPGACVWGVLKKRLPPPVTRRGRSPHGLPVHV